MPTFIDSHAHLGDEAFDDDRDEVLRRAAEVGVEAVVVIGYDADSSRRALEVARAEVSGGRSRPSLHATAGIAPHHVHEADDRALAAVRRTLAESRVVAVGEIGLEYHYDLPRPAQRDLFARQLEWAGELGFPVVVHSREAEHDMVPMLSDYVASLEPSRRVAADPSSADRASEARPPGVLHCFTESAAMAEALVELGFMVSFAGILTFKNAAALREVAARVPLERTLIETDSPFLAPVPHRGHRNEPAFVVEVARALAGIHGLELESVAAITAANARRAFGLISHRGAPEVG